MTVHLLGLICALLACGLAWLLVKYERGVMRLVAWMLKERLR